jgi:hypothetical protein
MKNPELKILWPFDGLVLLVWFSTAISTIFSIDRAKSLADLLILCGFVLVYFFASRLRLDFRIGVLFLIVAVSAWLSFDPSREILTDHDLSWQIAVSALKTNFLLGSGPGTFAHDWGRFKPAFFNFSDDWLTRFNRASNFWAEVLATLGFFGLFSYFWLALGLVKFKLENDRFRRVFGDTGLVNRENALFLVLAIIFIARFFYYQEIILGLGFWLVLGLFVAQLAEERKIEKIQNRGWLILGSVAGFLLFFLVSFFVFKTGLASFFYQRALTIGNEGEKTRLLLKAIDWDSNRAEYLVVLSQAMMAQGENILALASSQKATEVSPNQASTWENLGLVYQKLGSAPEAVDAFEKAVALEPTNPYLYFKIGQTYFEAGQKTEARENFIKSIQFKPDFETPRLYLGLIQDSDAK